MTFDEYMRAVEEGNYPSDPRVPANEAYKDSNGIITNLAFGKFGGAAFIYSTVGSIRSNHYHKTDSHFLCVVNGRVRYLWRPAEVRDETGKKPEPEQATFGPGDVFFTPPMMEHAVVTMETSEIISVSRLSRRHSDHEADLVRIQLVSKGNVGLVVHR